MFLPRESFWNQRDDVVLIFSYIPKEAEFAQYGNEVFRTFYLIRPRDRYRPSSLSGDLFLLPACLRLHGGMMSLVTALWLLPFPHDSIAVGRFPEAEAFRFWSLVVAQNTQLVHC